MVTMPLQQGQQCHCNNGTDACALMAMAPSQKVQQCQLDDGKMPAH